MAALHLDFETCSELDLKKVGASKYASHPSTRVLCLAYAVDNGNAAVEALQDGESITDSFVYTIADTAGATASATLTVTIHGTNDAAVLSGDTRTLTETNSATDIGTSGTLTISDVDGPAAFVAQAGTVGTYGTFAIDAAGAWTYTASSAHDEFVAGTTYTVGQTEREILGEVQRLLAIKAEEELAANPTAQVTDLHSVES